MTGGDITGLILVIIGLILLSPMILAIGGIIAVASLVFAPFWALLSPPRLSCGIIDIRDTVDNAVLGGDKVKLEIDS